MDREDYARELRSQLYETRRADQAFYIRYSALALGLLMTLQALGVGKEAVYGPMWLWVTAMLSFLFCLLISGPMTYWMDSAHFEEMASEMLRDGALSDYAEKEKVIRRIDMAGRVAFVAGCVSSVGYFICQRACLL